MPKKSLLLFGGAIFSCGFMLGLGYQIGSMSPSARANVLTLTETQRVYQELDREEGPLVSGSGLLAKIAHVTSPSVVHIQSERPGERGGRVEETGSGVLMDSSKTRGIFVITNRHVVADAKMEDISIHLHDGRVIRPARVWTDEATDVAVLLVEAPNLIPARWGDSDQVEIGHMVLAMGSPFGLSQSITYGIISAKGRRSLNLGSGRTVLNQDFLQTDAAINPGNSGGPLIGLHGRVIGINTAIASNSGGNEGIGFSIPSNLVRRVVDQLLLYGKVRRSYLGVKLDSEFTAATARRLQISRLRGARVVEVYPNTPAALAKLEFDDVILTFEGTEVLDENHLINLVSLTPVGRQVRLEVMRNGRMTNLDVLLADREDLVRRANEQQQSQKSPR
jgi:serine protease Do